MTVCRWTARTDSTQHMYEIHVWLVGERIQLKGCVHHEWKRTTLLSCTVYPCTLIHLHKEYLQPKNGKGIPTYFPLKLSPKQYKEQGAKHNLHLPWNYAVPQPWNRMCGQKLGGRKWCFSSEIGPQAWRRVGIGAEREIVGYTSDHTLRAIFPIKKQRLFNPPLNLG